MAFLAGLFDSDGCVHANPSGRTTLTFSRSGKEQYFTRHVQDVALSLGLVLGHSLNTKGENFQESKSIVLMNLAANSDEEAVGELSRLMGKVERFASDSGLLHANNSGRTRVLGKVVSVEKVGPMETYDVEVENSHWYYAGAVRSHNTASLVLGTSSGIHAWHDEFYIRRMRFSKNEPVAEYLSGLFGVSAAETGSIVEQDAFNEGGIVVSIPQRAPEGAATREEGAMALLERVKRYTREWIEPGNVYGGMRNNISATINIKPSEWAAVHEWMWNNRYEYNGLSLLPHSEHTYTQAPFETIDETTFEQMSELIGVMNVDLLKVVEFSDNTN
ncbi:MAG: hypothetical protein LC650_05865, partial [Actinobacteria bacterium]|nr:hypothetical protein [Actinomycetota bacterium]